MTGAHPFDLIEQAAADVMAEVGGEITADVQERLSVPVGYARGPRGGTIIIRSKPGENPRRETGELQQSIAGQVIRNPAGPALEISSDAKHAPFLDPRLTRPIFTGVVDEYQPVILDRLTERIANLSSTT